MPVSAVQLLVGFLDFFHHLPNTAAAQQVALCLVRPQEYVTRMECASKPLWPFLILKHCLESCSIWNFFNSCSEKYIDLSALKKLIPSRCGLGPKVCQTSCHAIGRRNGTCIENHSGKNCRCSEESVSGEEFAKCHAETTCSLYCKGRGFAYGKCEGWTCQCMRSIQRKEMENVTEVAVNTTTKKLEIKVTNKWRIQQKNDTLPLPHFRFKYMIGWK